MKGATRAVHGLPRALRLAMMLMLIGAADAGAVEPELAVVGGTGAPGDTVRVVIRLANDVADAGVSADLDVDFPSDLIEIDPPVAQRCTVAARLATTHQVGGTLPRPGLLRFALFARDLRIAPLGDGDLASCDFHILPGARLGPAPLTVVFSGLFNTDGQVIADVGVDGAIVISNTRPNPTPTVRPRCAADCNGQGQVSIEELIRGVAIALGTVPLTACLAMDTNADGAVSIAELISGVNGAMRGCPS